MKLSRDDLDEMRRHFLGHMKGFRSFADCGEVYLTGERAYKDELASLFRQEVMPLFEPLATDGSSKPNFRLQQDLSS